MSSADYEALRRKQQKDRDAAIQARLDREAAQEKWWGSDRNEADAEFGAFFKGAIGADIADMRSGKLDVGVAEAMDAISTAAKKGQTGKAKRLTRKHKTALKAAAKKRKKWWQW